MQPEATKQGSTPTTRRFLVSAANSPARAHRAPRRGHRGNAASYGPINRAAESWTDRELTECLRRNPE